MQGRKNFCGILVCVNAFICTLLIFIKGYNGALFASFELAFLASLFIIILSFLSYQKNIIKRAQNAQTPTKTLGIFLKKNSGAKILKFKAINDDFKPTLKLALKNFRLFFSLAKLGAYAFLVLGFLSLQKQDLLDIVAFLSGISAVLLSTLAFGGFYVYRIKKATQNKAN